MPNPILPENEGGRAEMCRGDLSLRRRCKLDLTVMPWVLPKANCRRVSASESCLSYTGRAEAHVAAGMA